MCVCVCVCVCESISYRSSHSNHSYRIRGLAEKFIGWKFHPLLMTFFTNRIQALQHRWKKCVNRKEVYVEK